MIKWGIKRGLVPRICSSSLILSRNSWRFIFKTPTPTCLRTVTVPLKFILRQRWRMHGMTCVPVYDVRFSRPIFEVWKMLAALVHRCVMWHFRLYWENDYFTLPFSWPVYQTSLPCIRTQVFLRVLLLTRPNRTLSIKQSTKKPISELRSVVHKQSLELEAKC